MMADLQGETAVITGGGGGLGAALGRVFAGAGMSVALLDIEVSQAEENATAIAVEFDVPTLALRVDTGDPVSIVEVAQQVESNLGACHVLCANVGVQQFGSIDRLTDHDWKWVMDVNVLGTIRTVTAFLPLLRKSQGWRRIVLTASSSVLTPAVRMAAYQTSKFAVAGFGETLRRELAAEGIGVTVLFPGGMMTGHLDSSARARPAPLTKTGAQEDDLTEMLADLPMGPDDLVTPEHAVRNLMQSLLDDEPYVVTHGSLRAFYNGRRDAMERALDRMEST